MKADVEVTSPWQLAIMLSIDLLMNPHKTLVLKKASTSNEL